MTLTVAPGAEEIAEEIGTASDAIASEAAAGIRKLEEMLAKPRYLSPIPEGTDIEAAHVGARLQRLPLTPQGELIAGVMEAKREDGSNCFKQVTVQIPRRSTKTTSIQNVLLGRCATIPGYQVVSTAQDGTRASQFFRDMMADVGVPFGRMTPKSAFPLCEHIAR